MMMFQKPDWRISPKSKAGFMETDIVATFIDNLNEAEPIGNCTEIYFWHMPKYPKDQTKKLGEKPSVAKAPSSYEALGSVPEPEFWLKILQNNKNAQALKSEETIGHVSILIATFMQHHSNLEIHVFQKLTDKELLPYIDFEAALCL